MRCAVKPSLSMPFGIALLATPLLASPCRSECIDYASYAHWAGGVELGELNDIAIQGELILTVGGVYNDRLCLVDVTVPDDPQLIGSLTLQDYAYAIAVSGRYACALERFYWNGSGDAGVLATDVRMAGNAQLGKGAGRFTGMEVIDISDPHAPSVVGSIFAEGCVAIAGAYAYVGHGTAIDVIDLTVPEQPAVINTVWLSAYVEHIAINGPTLYTAGRGLTIVDITDPAVPVETGHVGDFRGAEVAVTGGYAYVVNDIDDPMQVIDISDPYSPTVVATLELLGRGLFALGDRLYVAGWNATMVFDVTNPLEPRLVAQTEWWGSDLVASGDRAFVSGSYGLYVLGMANGESAPALLSLLEIPALDMALSGSLAYVAGGQAGLQVVHISDPEHPTVLTSFDTYGITEGVAVDGRSAFLADGSEGLIIVDVGTSRPQFVGRVDSPGWASDVAVQDGYAYLADGEAGLQVIDVSDPTSPYTAGSLPTPGEAVHLEIDGDYAYLADYDDGFLVIDISSPSHPVVVAMLDEGMRVYDLARAGSDVFLATLEGLVTVDVASPQAPQIRSATWLAGAAEGVAVADGYAYLTTWAARLNVLDVSDVDAPLVVGDSPAEGYWPHSMVARDGLVYSAQGGFRIYRSQCVPATTREERAESVTALGLRVVPNPGRGRTPIRLETPPTGNAGQAQLSIFDAAGRLVRRLAATDPAGAAPRELLWDGHDDHGRPSPAGVYVARLSVGGRVETARIVILH